MEQLHFLQNLLGGIENENQMDGYAYWWIGLNDVETEGEFVWPVNGPSNYTFWDVEMDAPFPGDLFSSVLS